MKIDFGLPDLPFSQHFTAAFCGEEVLGPLEKQQARGFSPKRLQHFSTGRYCAREALSKLGERSTDLLIGENKMPLWPKGFTGSISHGPALAGALAARQQHLLSVGLDIEKTGRVLPQMWDLLYTPREQEYLRSLPLEAQTFYTTLFFSMKESYYKLQFPLTRQALWFTDAEIDVAGSFFRISLKKTFAGSRLLPAFSDLHYATYQDQVVSACLLQA